MQFFTCLFLGVAMLIVNTFAAPLSEEMQALEEQSYMHERGSECQFPWKAVDGFQKCYKYEYSEEVIEYPDANQYCIGSKPGARLFTPSSVDETKKVDAAMIPSSVSGNARSFWTGYVQYAWQLANPKGPLLYAANAYPFEPLPKGMWAAGQPQDWEPYQEPCTVGGAEVGAPGLIGDTGCVWTGSSPWFKGHTILCEFAWTLKPVSTRRGTNMMQNAHERGQANLMQNGQERGQANLMQYAQERGQANLMHNAQERGQANLMYNAQERGQANLMHNAQKRGQANLMHNAKKRGQANLMHNAQERGQANLMYNAQERGQADLMYNAQERGQANLMHNALERGQANLMHNAQERGQANLMYNAQERGQANLMHNAQERGDAEERQFFVVSSANVQSRP